MSDYLQSMLVIHHDQETGDYVSRDVAVSDTDPYHYLQNSYFASDGSNAIMVIGNDQAAAVDYPTLGTDGRMSDVTVDMFDNFQCREVYIGRGLVSIPVQQDTTIWMQRATGLLVVQVVDMPYDITRASLRIENLVSVVNWNLQYTGEQSPADRMVFNPEVDPANIGVVLPPNLPGETSPVTIYLEDESGVMALPTVPVTMERNKITVLRANYDDVAMQWIFSVLVDGGWESVEPLELPNN